MGNVDWMKFNLLGKGNSHSLINSNHRRINEYQRKTKKHRELQDYVFRSSKAVKESELL